MGNQVHADDDVYRAESVYLGPEGWTLPWHARYSAYGVFVVVFGVWVAVQNALTGNVGFPLWQVIYSVMVTVVIMRAVDYDRPVVTVLIHTLREAPHLLDYIPRRAASDVATTLRPRRIKITRSPHEAPFHQ